LLSRYFTNVDLPVFALVNLPEVVKGALFARYSRSNKSLRRLFLDEFASDVEGAGTADVARAAQNSEALYDRVFVGFGDDSVAQLGGAHLACEQSSNLLTKILERPRLGSYLEQSTRYMPYDVRRSNGTWRYYDDPELAASRLGERYRSDMDFIFSGYSDLLGQMTEHYRRTVPCVDTDLGPWKQATRAKALDAVRGLLPAASLSNLGIFASGQTYEALLMRMRGHPLLEARQYAAMMLHELRKVIPSFLRRVDIPDRGGAWSGYFTDNRNALDEVAELFFTEAPGPVGTVTLVHWDPAAEDRMLAAAIYPHTLLPLAQVEARVAKLGAIEKLEVLQCFVGDRANRRHRPGRALEMPVYTFDVLSDYGAFRDLQRHRMLTIDWQRLSPAHGYAVPEDVAHAGHEGGYRAAMERSAALYQALARGGFGTQAQYAVALAFRLRYQVTLNAREAMHLTELRSGPAGHPSYRFIAQEMHRLIGEKAGHHAVAAMMRFVDYSGADQLGRLDAERRSASRADDKKAA
jgi:thymidylate synthase ThyX